MTPDSNKSLKIIRIKQLVERVGISRSNIYDRLSPRSPRYDMAFPRPIKIGVSAVGWLEFEVDEWIRERIALSANRLKGDGYGDV